MNSTSASPPPAAWYSRSVARRLRPRRALLELVVEGTRATWHVAARWALTAGAALAALLVVVDQHRVCEAWGHCDADDWGASHSLLADHGGQPLLLFSLVAAMQLGGLRRKTVVGVLIAVGSLVIAFLVAGQLAFTHFLSSVDGGDGAVAVSLVVAAGALGQIVLELVLAVHERRELEARDPALPHAAVVERA